MITRGKRTKAYSQEELDMIGLYMAGVASNPELHVNRKKANERLEAKITAEIKEEKDASVQLAHLKRHS